MGFIIIITVFGAILWPAVNFITKYSFSVHKQAIVKAFFLWFVCTFPVFGGIMLSKPELSTAVAKQLNGQILASFTLSEMFVYSAAFLAPVLYVVFDIIKFYQEVGSNINELFRHMRGMRGIIISSIFILLLTSLAYASEKSDPTGFSQTYLALLLTKHGYLIYLASLIIWYTVILWEIGPKNDAESTQDGGANQFADSYVRRRTGQ